MEEKILRHYSRKDVQREIVELSKDREVGIKFGDAGYGKRPDMLQFEGDVLELAKRGATSFHVSEERWADPLILGSASKTNIDSYKKGWDLVIDVDTKFLNYAKICTRLLIDAFEFYDISCYGLKFSVIGGTPILIRQNKNISLLPISEAISLFKRGVKVETLSLDENKKLIFSGIYDYLIHDDEIYELNYQHSRIPLKVTGHHSLFVLENGCITQKKVSEIKRGDHLVTFNASQNPFSPNFAKTITHTFEFSKNQYNTKVITKRIRLSLNLMRLIGYYLAEGHVTNIINQTGFSFNKNEDRYISDCISLLKKVTNRKNISIRHPNSGSTQILIHSKEWATFFETLCGKKNKKYLPYFVWNLPKNFFLELLKGYIRGDGHKNDEFEITIKSVSYKLITELVWLCKLNGISCAISTEQNKPHLSKGILFKGNFIYIIRISKSEVPIKEFFRGRNKYSSYPKDKIFPIDGLKQVYRQIRPKLFNHHRTEQMTLAKNHANKERIRQVIRWFKCHKSNDFSEESKRIIKSYESLICSDVGVVEVNTIRRVGIDKVYDVSVEKTEAFFGNEYPILLHNSGGSGFHLAIPFEAFPKFVNGREVRLMFPEYTRIVAAYLKNMISDELRREILKISSQNEIANVTGKKFEDIVKNNVLDPFCVVDIDPTLISSRHLFRAAYSINEKTGLVSIPLDKENLKNFELRMAKIENIEIGPKFLKRNPGYEEASKLMIQAFDWYQKNFEKKHYEKSHEEKKKQEYARPETALNPDLFPPCILCILGGIKIDGRKRALFILINFLRKVGYDYKEIEDMLEKWDEKNYVRLKHGYINSQINWHKKQKEGILPPNCDNAAYYQDLNICLKDNFCKNIRNPVQYRRLAKAR